MFNANSSSPIIYLVRATAITRLKVVILNTGERGVAGLLFNNRAAAAANDQLINYEQSLELESPW